MTVNDIFENCLALGLELHGDNTDFDSFVVPHFNLLIAELQHYNNVARERNGKEKLASYPFVHSKEDESPFEEVLYSAVVYGLYAKLMLADGDSEQGGTYLQMYYAHRDAALKAEAEDVEDCYAADYC